MKKVLIGLLALVFVAAQAPHVDAHPGRTDSKGGHYCRTNCEKWGLSYGEYHYHNSGKSTTKTTTKSTSKTTVTRKATAPAKPALVTVPVYINGVKQQYPQSAYIKNGTTLVPMRQIFEELGATVEWDNTTRTVIGTKDGKTIKLGIGNKVAYVTSDGVSNSISLSHPAEITNGSTMVPLRFISESLGANVQWDSAERSVKITK